MRGDAGRGPEPRSARAGARVEGRVLIRAAIGVLIAWPADRSRARRLSVGLSVGLSIGWWAAIALGLASGCGGPGSTRPRPGADCRPLAVHGRRLLDAAPAGQQGEATRAIAGLIELCQRPGLTAPTRTCALAAPTVAALRACPVRTEDPEEDDPALACDRVVDHAMRMLRAGSARPRGRDGRAEARAAYQDGCAALAPVGRRCVLEATTIAAVDDCFADASLGKPPG